MTMCAPGNVRSIMECRNAMTLLWHLSSSLGWSARAGRVEAEKKKKNTEKAKSVCPLFNWHCSERLHSLWKLRKLSNT